jgi:hypothetical protein
MAGKNDAHVNDIIWHCARRLYWISLGSKECAEASGNLLRNRVNRRNSKGKSE